MAEPIRVDSVSRRTVLKGMAGAAGLVSIPAIIAACSSTTTSSAPSAARQRRGERRGEHAPASAAAVGTLTIGSYHTRPRRAEAGQDAVNDAFTDGDRDPRSR